MAIVITTYENPDLDGIACAIAYAEFLQQKGKDAVAIFFGKPHLEAQYVIDAFNIKYPKSAQNESADSIIMVDCSYRKSLPKPLDPEKVIEVIDHRRTLEETDFPRAKYQIELVGAAATLIAEKYKSSNIELSDEATILLYGAIISNTLNFQNNVTTQRDRDMAAWLLTKTDLSTTFIHDMFLAKSDLSGPKLKQQVAGDFAKFMAGDKRIGIAQLEIIGIEELAKQRGDEIITILRDLKKEFVLDIVFASLLDLEKNITLFLTEEAKTKKLLNDILDIKFDNDWVARPGLIMRKETIPLIKQKLES